MSEMKSGCAGIVARVIALFVSVSFVSFKQDRTALCMAAWTGHDKIVDELLREGASIHATETLNVCECIESELWGVLSWKQSLFDETCVVICD